jgi:DNA-binding NarL/FixJ family response regulator
MIVVGAVDDHPLVQRGQAATLAAADPRIRLVATASTVSDLLGRWVTPLSVVLLDLHLGDGSDIADNVRRLRQQAAGVLIVTSDHRPAVVGQALDAGALGLVLKEDPEESLVEAIWDAARGSFAVSSRLAQQLVTDPARRVRLSRQELEALGLLARGLPWSAIGKEMNLGPDTARTYCYRVVEKYTQAGTDIAHGPREVAFRVFHDGFLDLQPGSLAAEQPEIAPSQNRTLGLWPGSHLEAEPADLKPEGLA